jgi:peroxiredoxin
MPNLIAIGKPPAGISGSAMYGYNFVVAGKNRGWVLDGDEQRGWVLYLDMDGTGDLSAVQPARFEKVDGAFRLEREVTEGNVHWPIRFQITSMKVENEDKLAVAIQVNTIRKGTIEIGGTKVPFTLTGSGARYDRIASRVAFDRQGNGKFDSYKISDRYVNLAGKTYAFSVDVGGNALTLEESETQLPDRPALETGTQAPMFIAADIDQKARRLEDYLGRLLLLEFWSTNCGPCREEAPKMAKFFQESAQGKLDFLGITTDQSEEHLRAFLKETGMSWPQIREGFDGAIHRNYRAEGEPTYFLIGAKGEILDAWVGGGLAIERVSKYTAR